MNKRRKFRPTVNGLEERLALNGTLSAAGLVGAHAAAAADVKTTTHHHTTHHHKTHHHKMTK